MYSRRRWSAWHLATAWTTYWIALAALKLYVPIRLGWQLSQQPDGTASISAGVADMVLKASMTSYDQLVWAGSVSLAALGLWIAGPPMLIWIAWLLTRNSTHADSRRAIHSADLLQPGISSHADLHTPRSSAQVERRQR